MNDVNGIKKKNWPKPKSIPPERDTECFPGSEGFCLLMSPSSGRGHEPRALGGFLSRCVLTAGNRKTGEESRSGRFLSAPGRGASTPALGPHSCRSEPRTYSLLGVRRGFHAGWKAEAERASCRNSEVGVSLGGGLRLPRWGLGAPRVSGEGPMGQAATAVWFA